MMKSIYVICIAIGINILSESSFSQELQIFDKAVKFGVEYDEIGNSIWSKKFQIESEYPFIEVIEIAEKNYNMYGFFYEKKLIGLEVIVNTNEAYPTSEDIDKLTKNIPAYKEETSSDPVAEIVDYYKTESIYISVASSRMNIDYFLFPIKQLENIQSAYPTYMKNFTK